MREQKTDESIYRYSYQGQFAEKDLETGWNHFELREYDPVIGRWTATDPAGQYWSSYIGMGNNPVSSGDPGGAYSKFGAWWLGGGGSITAGYADWNDSVHKPSLIGGTIGVGVALGGSYAVGETRLGWTPFVPKTSK